MLKADLITGFLGAGKTTFLKRYLEYLLKNGLRVRIIENEFGPMSVDTALLSRESTHCEVTDLTGLCMCCTGREEFMYQLEEAARQNYDRILIEPSGIYDVDEFFETMLNPRIAKCCEIGSIITIVDSAANMYPSEEARYLAFCQLLAAGRIILSKTDQRKGNAEKAKAGIRTLLDDFGYCDDLPTEIWEDPADTMTDADFEALMDSGCNRVLHDRMQFIHNEAFVSTIARAKCQNQNDLTGKMRRLFRASVCGKVYRAKGFTKDASGQWYAVNCTPGTLSVEPCETQRNLLIIIGQNLHEDAIRHILGDQSQ